MTAEGQRLRIAAALIVILIAVAAFALTSCTGTPPVETKVVEVVKPVAVRPIEPKDVPAVPKPLPPRPSALSAAADLLASKWCEAVSYFLKADPKLRASAGMAQQDLPRYPECERP